VADGADLDALAALIRDRPITLLADEVYEHVLYDGRRHASVVAHPELRERSFAVFSFGKTLHATGWRIGYCAAPPALTRELRKVHQFNTFSIVSPLQYAIARYLAAHPDAWAGLPAFFQAKRDLLAGLLRGSGFEPVPAAGTYFQLVDYGALSSDTDVDFADQLIREAKVATIPLSPFYAAPPAMTLLRLCIAKRDATLEAAAERLCAFAAERRVPARR
jgi:methionine aminotransferase